MTNHTKPYNSLADELDALGAGTPQWAAPEVIGEGADAIRWLTDEVNRLKTENTDLQGQVFVLETIKSNQKTMLRTMREQESPLPLDPTPFLYEYVGGNWDRLQHAPTVSRVGWRFSPRPGYQQDVNFYDEKTRQYA